MATEKEIGAVNQLLAAALRVNASSARVDVSVDVNRSRVDVRISDPVSVSEGAWDWLFYSDHSAYFSGEVFREEVFLARCQELLMVIEGFSGYVPQEVK